MPFTRITDTNISPVVKTNLIVPLIAEAVVPLIAEAVVDNVIYSINLFQSGSLAINEGSTRWYVPYNATIINIKARVIISSLDTDIIALVKKNGSTVATITIPANSTSANTYNTPISLLYGDYLTVGISQIGSSSRVGSDLYLQFNYQKN